MFLINYFAIKRKRCRCPVPIIKTKYRHRDRDNLINSCKNNIAPAYDVGCC